MADTWRLGLHQPVLFDKPRGLLSQLDPAARVGGNLGACLHDLGRKTEEGLEAIQIELL